MMARALLTVGAVLMLGYALGLLAVAQVGEYLSGMGF